MQDEALMDQDEAVLSRSDCAIDPTNIETMIDAALAAYKVRILDNIDLTKVRSPASRARLVANALLDRGDARAFFMGRKLLAAASRS